MTVRVLDIETTGLSCATNKIIEIASVDLAKHEGSITVVNPLQTYVDPGVPIPPCMSAIHHILDEDVKGAPSFAEAIEAFKGADVYVAHNADFEADWLEMHLPRGAWVCTFKCALRVWPELPEHNLQALRYQLGLVAPFGYVRAAIHPHRAASDVIVTAAVLVELMKAAKWSELLTWSAEPALYTRLHFGKHRGERFDQVPEDYLDWCQRQPDMDAGVKFSIEYWLRNKRQRAAA